MVCKRVCEGVCEREGMLEGGYVRVCARGCVSSDSTCRAA